MDDFLVDLLKLYSPSRPILGSPKSKMKRKEVLSLLIMRTWLHKGYNASHVQDLIDDLLGKMTRKPIRFSMDDTKRPASRTHGNKLQQKKLFFES